MTDNEVTSVESESFAYFMVRVRRAKGDANGTRLSGTIERLGTGEKHRFEDAAELIRWLAHGQAMEISEPAKH